MLLIVLLSTTFASAMGGTYGPGKGADSHSDEWPKGLTALLDLQAHVGGYWVNANDFYWFAGDTKALNQFLVQGARLEGTTVYIRFHAGKGESHGFADQEVVPIDWQLSVVAREWSDEWPKGSPTPYMIRIDVWDGRHVDKKAVEVPAGILLQADVPTTQATTRRSGKD